MYTTDKILFSHPMDTTQDKIIESFDMINITNPRRKNDSMSQPIIVFHDTKLTGYT